MPLKRRPHPFRQPKFRVDADEEYYAQWASGALNEPPEPVGERQPFAWLDAREREIKRNQNERPAS